MEIKRITDSDTLLEVFKFRHKVLVEELGYLPEKSGQITDIYDECAHNYASFDASGKILGSIRVVPDNKYGLPVERLCSLGKYRQKGRLAESCRLVIAKESRSSRLFIKLITAAYQCALLTESTHLVLDTYLKEEPLYRRLGFRRISNPYSDPIAKRNAMVVALIARITTKSVSLIPNQAIQDAILSINSNEINHGGLVNQRNVLEKFSFHKSGNTAEVI